VNYRPITKKIQRPAKVDPFSQGLPKEVVIRLLEGKHTKMDRARYYLTPWFKGLVAAAIEAQEGHCQVCGNSPKVGLTYHHNALGYKNLFAERVAQDGIVVCKRCHQRIEGKL